MVDSITTTAEAARGRGCGERKEGEAYACFGIGSGGRAIEDFIVDPVRPWPGKFQRFIKILPRDPANPGGLCDLMIFIGAENYPSVWSYIEEARRFGVSRRMPANLSFERLTPGQSKMVLVHSKAIPLSFNYVLNRPFTPLRGCKHTHEWLDAQRYSEVPVGYHPGHEIQTMCTFALQDLAVANHHRFERVGEDKFRIDMPSFSFEGNFPHLPDLRGQRLAFQEWGTGIFMALPLTHFEFRNKAQKVIWERAKAAGFQTAIVNW